MQLLQALPRYVCINLCGGDLGMSQQHLHYAQVRAVIEQMRGESVTQGVW